MSQPQESAYSEEDVARNLSSMAIWEGVSTLPEGEAKDLTHTRCSTPTPMSKVGLVREDLDHFVIFVNDHLVARRHKLSIMKPASVIQN